MGRRSQRCVSWCDVSPACRADSVIAGAESTDDGCSYGLDVMQVSCIGNCLNGPGILGRVFEVEGQRL